MMALAAVAAFALFASAAGAAGTITLQPGKGGVNGDGTCGQVSGTGTQLVWQFNLTGIKSGGDNALLTATFAGGGSVTNVSPDQTQGGVAMWFVTTPANATLISASADGTNVTFGPGNPQLVVSHCTASGTSGPPS
jgi:hypothetical protein